MPHPRRLATGPASHVFAVRLTDAEQALLSTSASAANVKPGEHFRAWVAGGARIGAETGTLSVNASPAPPPPSFVVARERPGEKVEFWSRWTPRHVFTLHRVPGRLDGSVLAVRRRVLQCISENFEVETPGGTMGLDEDAFASSGHERSFGSSRLDVDLEPGPSGWGYNLAIDVYDHVPTEEERAEWLDRRRKLSAALAEPPAHAFLVAPGKTGKYTSSKVPIRRTWTTYAGGSCNRFDLEYLAEGAWFRQQRHADLRDLAELGWSDLGDGARLCMKAPTLPELADLESANRKRVEDDEKGRAEAREFFGAARRPPADPPGAVALRSFGLDPQTATLANLQAAFASAASAGHSDRGGKLDMGELVRRRDQGREHIAGRLLDRP